jgi:hypothetical protein
MGTTKTVGRQRVTKFSLPSTLVVGKNSREISLVSERSCAKNWRGVAFVGNAPPEQPVCSWPDFASWIRRSQPRSESRDRCSAGRPRRPRRRSHPKSRKLLALGRGDRTPARQKRVDGRAKFRGRFGFEIPRPDSTPSANPRQREFGRASSRRRPRPKSIGRP